MRGEPNVAARGCRPVAQRAAIYAALKPKGGVESGLLRFGADGETGRGWGVTIIRYSGGSDGVAFPQRHNMGCRPDLNGEFC